MKTILAIWLAVLYVAGAQSTNVYCVCTTNIIPAPSALTWHASIPTAGAAWFLKRDAYLVWMNEGAPLDTETAMWPPPFGRYTTNNTVQFVRRTNAFGNAQWVARMPIVPGQVWQMRYSRTCDVGSIFSLGAEPVNGFWEYSFSGSLSNGFIYARRLK